MRYIYNDLTVQTALAPVPDSISDELFANVCDEIDRRRLCNDALSCGEIACGRSKIYFPTGTRSEFYIDQDIHELSLLFPDLYFILAVEDANNGDYYKEYHHTGQVQYCNGFIAYAPPQPANWKNYDDVIH